jgi:hypothetical protein
MVKQDRAYADWQSRTARREAREIDRAYGWEAGELSFGGEKRITRSHSVNETSRRAGKSTAARDALEVAQSTETVKMRNGASFTFVVFDEASKLSPAEEADQKPVFDPQIAYDHAESASGKRLTGSQKRKVFTASLARHEKRVKEWEERMTQQELDALQDDLNRSALGFGAW